MLRRCCVRRQANWAAGKNPDVHRHAQSTFHEGVHREPPKPYRSPYQDAMSPWGWAKATVLNTPGWRVNVFFFLCLATVGYYAFCVSYDIKTHYLMNKNMHRELHLQRCRTQEAEQRCSMMEKALTAAAVAVPEEALKLKKNSGAGAADGEDEQHQPAFDATNYEFELSRERARAKELHQQHQILVHELADVRVENTKLRKQLQTLQSECEHYKRLVDKFHVHHDQS